MSVRYPSRWLLVVLTAFSTACFPAQPQAEIQAVAADTLTHMVATLRSAQALDATAAVVWPGFRLREQVLILTAPSGLTILAGDPNPPEEFRPLAAGEQIFIRRGTVPDSLTGLRIGMPWNGRLATVVSYSETRLLETLVHEAFHTYQRTLNDRFPGGMTPQFPDTSLAALSLLNLEGRYLAHALGASHPVRARNFVLTALAVRARRCAILGREECDAERRIEQSEGSAVYVTALSLGSQLAALADSLRPVVSRVEDLPRLQRFHFYDTGLAWLLLMDRLGPTGWKARLGSTAADSLLSERLGFTAALRDSLALVAEQSSEAVQAKRDAEHALAAEAIFADSVAQAFAAQHGIPIRIRWRSEHGTRRSQFVWFPGQRRSVNTYGEEGNRNTYVIGAREARYGFAEEGNHLVIRAPALWICCRAQSVEVRAPVRERLAQVNGTVVPLDIVGRSAEGPLTLELPEIEFHARRAEVNVYADSVTIWLRSAAP